MGQRISKNWRTIAATFFSVALIASAYVLARGIEIPQVAEASAETALLQAIATKDSTGDGLPDWEKALYGIPLNATTTDYFNLGMTDGEAVAKGLIVPKAVAEVPQTTSTGAVNPINYAAEGLTPPTEGTLTDAFAKNFFALYTTAKEANGGTDLTPEQTSALVEQSMTQFIQNFAPAADFKKSSDLTIQGSGPEALRAFAVAAEAVFKQNKSDATKSDLAYLSDVAVNNDADAAKHLASLSTLYRSIATGLAALTAPTELASTHLAIVNSLMRLSQIYSDFSNLSKDPLTGMLALQQYASTEKAAEQAFVDLNNTYVLAGVVLNNSEPGASFVNLIANLTARQQAAAQ